MPEGQNSPARRPTNRQLENAVERVCETWFPVNPAVLEKVQAGLQDDRYENNRQALLLDLKKDVSLYGYCIKRLSQKRHEGILPEESGCLPARLISGAPRDLLREIFSVSAERISPHRLRESSKEQLSRLKDAIIAASVAELMSTPADIDPETAYGCGLFRQLGMALIAWNFPHVYKRVTTAEQNTQELEAGLSKMLGFSPTMLGMAVVRRWDLSREFMIGMGDKEALAEARPLSPEYKIGQRLDHICQVGEVLAQASDPLRYPNLKYEWHEAIEEIQKVLGSSALAILRHKLDENCVHYLKLAPELFNCEGSIEPGGAQPQRKSPALLAQSNKYIQRCPEEMQSALKEIYEAMDGVSLARDSVEKLTHEIIPQAGFTRGCIYLLEPGSMTLMPRLTIGRSGDFKPVRYTSQNAGLDPVVAAFRCNNPILEERVMIDGRPASFITGTLGEVQKAGVLYLQFRVEADPQHGSRMMNVFKAIRQTLSDCLLIG